MALDATLPLAVPVLIGGDAGAPTGIESTDPGRPGRLVAAAGEASADEVAAAVDAAAEAVAWAAPSRGRARRRSWMRAAELLRERRLELAALEVRECAKPWAEADADVCEAIDFLSYYARGAVELERGPGR